MIDIAKIDYSPLDHPLVSSRLFHPRPEFGPSDSAPHAARIMIPVDAEIDLGATFHVAENTAPSILFFHGNGEIVADYDDFAQMLNRMGINFLAVDYRGYGRSGGQPGVTAMMRDCHMVFDFVERWRQKNNGTGPLVLMGRSLGSASVLELASHYAARIDGLIVESGFARSTPLLLILGIHPDEIGFEEDKGFGNLDKIRKFHKPTLIIHAERDHIIPFSEGASLFEACPAADKTLLKIRGANHNDILMRGLQDYLAAMAKLVQQLMPPA